MKEHVLKPRELYGVLGVCGATLFLSLLFLIASLRAELLYRNMRMTLPTLASEKPEYYRAMLGVTQRAITLQPDNARHYIKKAEYLWNAIQDTDARANGYDVRIVEELYEKAATLNPLNYAYHLQLGLFYYDQKDLPQAEKYLTAAHALYPQDYLPYFYLSKYYFQDKQPSVGFAYLLQAFHRCFRNKTLLRDEMNVDTYKSSGLIFDVTNSVMYYTFLVRGQRFDLKEQQFPHEPIPVRLRVYVSSDARELLLYCKQILIGPLKKLDVAETYAVYEATISTFPKMIYLDDFWIQVSPPARIEKVECVYNLYY